LLAASRQARDAAAGEADRAGLSVEGFSLRSEKTQAARPTRAASADRS
jgi:hypothetical protein